MGEWAAYFDQDTSWYDNAACRTSQIPTSDFYFEAGVNPPRHVVACCNNCPVKNECLEYAVEGNIYYGYWNSTPRERMAIRKQRRTVTSVRLILLPA